MDLLTVLEDAGITGLHATRREIDGRCPMHEARTGKADKHPSWRINQNSMLHFCHSCGYKGTLQQLLIDLTGAAPVDLEETLRKQSFLRKMAEVRQAPEDILEPVIPILTEWALANALSPVPQKLLDLKWLRRSAIDTYEVRWERDTRRWVLPLRAGNGDLLGAQYRQKGSVFTLPEGMEKSTTLFGITHVEEFDYAVLVESPLDAVRLFGLGIPAVSSLGAWVSGDQVRMMARLFSRLYVCLDNDKAGHISTEQLLPSLRRSACVPISWVYDEMVDEDGKPAKDPGDATDESILASWERTRRWGVL